MAIPKWHEFLDPVVRLIAAEGPMVRAEIYRRVADITGLSDADRLERLNTGGLRYHNRIGWALSDALEAQLIGRPTRSVYDITDRGRRVVASPAIIDRDLLRAFPEYQRRRVRQQPVAPQELVGVAADQTPVELIDSAAEQLVAEIESEVYRELLAIEDPYFFEFLVTRFVASLGYGVSYELTAKSGDGGVDGIVWRDKLGLDRIYVQAKKYAEGQRVSIEAVRAFLGTLEPKRANAGVFITTSTFSEASRREAELARSTNVRLIDGRELAHLMVANGIGVRTRRTIEVKALDSDFFTPGETE